MGEVGLQCMIVKYLLIIISYLCSEYVFRIASFLVDLMPEEIRIFFI